VRAPGSEAVFRVLNGREFQFDGDPCLVEVFGVYDDGKHRWVQLALDGGQHHRLVTLRLSTTNCRDCALVSLIDLGASPPSLPAEAARIARVWRRRDPRLAH